MNRIAPPLLALVIALPLSAAAQSHTSPAHPLDATWTKIYATSCGPSAHQCLPSANGYVSEFIGDPRLPVLLKRALPQRESWWVDGDAVSAPVSDIAQVFIAVPHNFILDDDRYVTATGCVPHDCLTNGMLWIDTGTQPATVVFAAELLITNIGKGDANHLWLYSNTKLNFEDLPPDLLINLKRWHGSIATREFPQTVTVATLVQPNGRMQDLTYGTLFYKQNQPHPAPTGAQP